MANVFEKGTKYAATALALLTRTIKTPGLFKRCYGKADFVGAAGDTINIRRPPVLRARDKGWRSANALVVDDIMQTNISVALTSFPYNAIHLTPEEATLDEVDYVRDVQAPQVNAMGAFWEDLIVATLAGATYALPTVVYNLNSADVKQNDARKVASRARKLFQDAYVPTSGRYWLVGSSVAEAIRDTDKLLEIDASGLPEALRDGVVTKVSGFLVVELDALGENESYFIHEDAIAIATVAPVVPKGAVGGSSLTAPGGLAITQLWDYDAMNAKDRSIVMAFAGATPVLDPQIAKTGPDKGLIVLAGEPPAPVMQFVRAAKVTFTPKA